MWWWFVFLTPEAPILFQKILFWLVIAMTALTVIVIIVMKNKRKRDRKFTNKFLAETMKKGSKK